MAVTTIATIQHRRGVKSDLPRALREGELGFCMDSRELFVGNAPPFDGNTQILTEYSPNDRIIQNTWRALGMDVNGTVPRSLGDKLNDVASIKDFGVAGDGIKLDDQAINNAIKYMFGTTGVVTMEEQSRQVTLKFPAGVYLLDQAMLLYPQLNIVGDGIGNTVITITNNPLIQCVMQTADSQGQIEGNIGSSGGVMPSNITIRDLTISTNGRKIDAVRLNRYRGVRFDNVEFIGGYQSADSGLFPHAGVVLSTYNAGVPVYGADISHCKFKSFTYALYASGPAQLAAVTQNAESVQNTTVSFCSIKDGWRGINLGQNQLTNGPISTRVVYNHFVNLDDCAINQFSSNPGVVSIGNRFDNTGTHSIIWQAGTTQCKSIGDTFSTMPGVLDSGTGNSIV